VLTYGVFGGIGLSLVWMPTVTSPSYYFTKKRALATGKLKQFQREIIPYNPHIMRFAAYNFTCFIYG
jgi:hypothetical protein